MLTQSTRAALEHAIERAAGTRFRIEEATPASGGCIHSSWVLKSSSVRYFAKVNEERLAASFEAEADGLAALATAGLRVPQPIAQGTAEGQAFLVLEYLPLGASSNAGFRALGRKL